MKMAFWKIQFFKESRKNFLTKIRIIFEKFKQNKYISNIIKKYIKNLSNKKFLFRKLMKIFPMKKDQKKLCKQAPVGK